MGCYITMYLAYIIYPSMINIFNMTMIYINMYLPFKCISNSRKTFRNFFKNLFLLVCNHDKIISILIIPIKKRGVNWIVPVSPLNATTIFSFIYDFTFSFFSLGTRLRSLIAFFIMLNGDVSFMILLLSNWCEHDVLE